METKELLQFAAQLGVGGVLAALIFLIAWRELKKLHNDAKEDKAILVGIVINNTKVIEKNNSSTEQNTAAIHDLRRELTARHRD